MKETHEIRHSFRIEDRIHLEFEELSEEEYQRRLAAPAEAGESSLVGELHALTAQAGQILVTIRKSQPEVAHYLGLLDKKIDMVARLLEGRRGGTEVTAETKVDLAAGGLAFWSDKPFVHEARLELRIVLFPSHLSIRALAMVVYVDEETPSAEGRYRIGVKFTRIGDAEQEMLARHLIERQSALLRRQRGGKDPQI